jgi:putative ABC transport system permease protein
MLKYAGLILKNLTRSKRRSILTILSIAASLFLFSALASFPTVARQIIADTASSSRIATHNKAGLTYSIPLAYKQKILLVPHVEAAVPQMWFGGILHDVNDQFPNFAMDHEDFDRVFPDWLDSNPQAVADFKKIRTACLVGPATMKRFGLHVGQQIQLRGTVYPFNVTLQIVGELGGKAPPNFMIFRRDYLEEAAGRPGYLGNIWVKVDRSENVPQVIAAIDEGFANSSAETLSESESAYIGGFLQSYRTMITLFEALGIIVVATIGLVAANTAAMSIRERRTELGVMRSIGFTSRTILSLLVAESMVVGLAGGILGAGGAFVLLKVFSFASTGMGGPLGTIRMPMSVLAIALVMAVMVGVLSAIVPASAAARKPIIETLRTIG